MSYFPINLTAIQQYISNAPAADYYLKAYIPATTTAISLYTDSTGTAVAKVKINSDGFAVNAANVVTALYIDQDYKLILYPNATTANANTTASAIWTITVNNLTACFVGTANKITSGTGTPEGVVTGAIGDLFLRTDGGVSTTLYVKTSGTGNTGWTGK